MPGMHLQGRLGPAGAETAIRADGCRCWGGIDQHCALQTVRAGAAPQRPPLRQGRGPAAPPYPGAP
eukprot:CAMPEP_0171192834 /NCGR_PEP_ID=MMETSP0790-20130122/20071_1 /TAXON_ID=2925 /ORGANISM="Alexandrium catenella, Strain OF101" /LENGTH=65 /DNA_ID=CAMNT_0011657999 /DNA_START=88 /DNA_END=282 /DNA_ORIENTATION=+